MTPDFNRGDRLVKKQIFSLNRHIPRKRKFLDELLKEDKPHVVGADGIRHRFKKDELKIIKEILDESELHLLKLPIYIEMDSNASGSRISGRLENKIICKILDIKECNNETYLYRQDIK
ncbi:DUF61 family protein, partial [Methanobacterium sp.]|uniref:DUF61 family protein n=1 Tax=Methanobacterium sp. TaxID=2164 RepID=UPI003C76ABE9